MKPQYTAAVIGCGAIANALHLPGYARRNDVARLIGVDPVAERRKEIVAKFPGIVTYADHRELFAHEDPDFVSVCSPNVYHAEHAIAALKAGAHLLLEKPMTLTLAEATAVKSAAARSGKSVMIGFSHRLIRSNQKIKQILEAGAIGEPLMIRVRFAHGGPFPGWARSDWFYQPQLAGYGALCDMGIHAIDLCQWLIGPITSVTAQLGTLRKDIALDDNAMIALKIGERAMGSIEVSWTCGPGFNGLEIYADNGTIINNYAEPLRICTGTSSPDWKAESDFCWQTIENDGQPESWEIEIDYFMDTILKGEQFPMGIDAGISALAVVLQAVGSARDGQHKMLPE